MLDEADISLKLRQTILRHSDPRLTMNRYTRKGTAAAQEAVNALPSVFGPGRMAGQLTKGLHRMPMANEINRGRISRTDEETADVLKGDFNPYPSNEKPPVSQGFDANSGPSGRLNAERGGYNFDRIATYCKHRVYHHKSCAS